MKTGLGKVSIESIANIFLNRYKNYLAKVIDETVASEMSLRPYMEQAWVALQEPTLLDEEYKMWVKTTPVSVGITPLETTYRSIKAKIGVECYNEVSFGEKPFFMKNADLPTLRRINEPPENFEMHFKTTIPFEEAERLTNEVMAGTSYTAGKKKVTIENIRLWGNGDNIVVDSELSGSYKGHIYFTGKPVFNPEKNQVEVINLDFHTETKNVLIKSAGWLFKGPIKKRMAAAMAYPVKEDIEYLKTSAEESLKDYSLYPGITLNGQIDEVGIERTLVQPNGIQVDLFANGKLVVNVGKFF